MAAENQRAPLAPTTVYGRSDGGVMESSQFYRPPKKSNKCLVYILTGIVFQGTILLVFAIALLKVSTPRIKLSSVAVQTLSYTSSPSVYVNLTMNGEVSIDNTNFGRFQFGSAEAVVLYQGVTIGGDRIEGGIVWARTTDTMNVTVEVTSNNRMLTGNQTQNLGGDLNYGVLELTSYAVLSGRVRVRSGRMNIVSRHVNTAMNCTIRLDLRTEEIQQLFCV